MIALNKLIVTYSSIDYADTTGDKSYSEHG
jgi:hypothetical protein